MITEFLSHSGQPYNQLAILCSSRSNKLAIAYYYIRSIGFVLRFLWHRQTWRNFTLSRSRSARIPS